MYLRRINNTGSNLLNQPKAGWLFPVFVALYITLVFNTHIYTLVSIHHPLESFTDALFFISLYCVVFFIVHFSCAILSIGKGMKIWLILLLLLCAIISYPRDQYTVVFDEIMLQNVIETDRNEAGELFSYAWVFYVLLSGCLPALLVAITPVKVQSLSKDLLHRVIAISSMAFLLILIMLPFHKSYEPLLDNHLSIEGHIAPAAFLYGIYKYFYNNYSTMEPSIRTIGTDAVLTGTLTTAKKIVMVIVVGESARTANFSLAGYARNTNPLLQSRINDHQHLVFYSNFFSCGTSTLVSIPCMFSASTKNDFNVADEKYRENLLDVLTHAGLKVSWVNNNLGCKGVCTRIRYIDMRGRTDDASCNKYGCADEMLAKILENEIQSTTDNLVIVLHQKGSHGPAYYKRTPKNKEKFIPACHINQLRKCSSAEIVNSYDNTIAYTDFVLDKIINTLEAHNTDRDTVMFYVSDHGESLGENNFYLHGMPLNIAPDEQTHIPALLWLSPGFLQRFNIDSDCLQKHRLDRFSHHNVSHTLLGLLNINTSAYKADHDITRPCRKSGF